MGRIELFAADVAYAQTPVLAYDAATFDFFVGQTVELAPTAGGFHDFQITGTLPAGLAFSTATGMITGTATTAAVSEPSRSRRITPPPPPRPTRPPWRSPWTPATARRRASTW